MKTLKQITGLLVLSLFFACAPAVNSAYQSSIDNQLTNVQPANKSYDHGPKAELAVGQWVRYKSLDKNGSPSIHTTQIIGTEGGLYWVQLDLETVSYTHLTLPTTPYV